MAALRIMDPPKISGVESLQIIGSSMFMLKEEHNKLLGKFLGGANRLPTHNSIRLFVEGSPLDNMQFYELAESCGATIVAEDNCWGNRYSDNPIDINRDPMEAIAVRYQNKSPCPYITFPEELRAKYCLEKVLEAKAQGVIFYIYEWDGSGTWDYPDVNMVLKKNGIPTLLLNDQKYLLSEPEKLRSQIREFITSL